MHTVVENVMFAQREGMVFEMMFSVREVTSHRTEDWDRGAASTIPKE